jgi:hypothetical protein
MVAASKMRKAQDRMRAARPYARRSADSPQSVPGNVTEYKHPFLVHASETSVGMILSRPTRVFAAVSTPTSAYRSERHEGNGTRRAADRNPGDLHRQQGSGFHAAIAGAKVVSHVVQLGDTPHLEKMIGPVKSCSMPSRTASSTRCILLYPLHQHDEAGTGARTASAADRRATRYARHLRGITSTSRIRRLSSTKC